MNPGRMFFPLLVIVLAMCIHEGLCIKCWECSSDYDGACNDPFDNTTLPLSDCSLKENPPQLPGARSTICRKIRQQVNGQVKIFRGCGFLNDSGIAGIGKSKKSCFMRTGDHNIVMEYCTCSDKDGCNTSATIYSNQLTIVFMLILTYSVSHF